MDGEDKIEKKAEKPKETEEEKQARRKAQKEAKRKSKEQAAAEKNKKNEGKSAPGTKKEAKEKDVDYYESNAKIVRPNVGKPVYVVKDNDNILITSALPYVNNVPHLGNIIGCVLSADVFARYERLIGKNVLFVCGTDEYGTATETKALEEKCSPKALCDKYHKIHSDVYKWFDCDFDIFGRTSTPIHSEITQEIFLALQKNGYISKREVEQFKCFNCNIILSDRYIYGKCYHPNCEYEKARGDQCDKCGKLCNAVELIEPKCKLCNQTPKIIKSFHYFLTLPNVQEKLQKWIEKASKEGKWSSNSVSITNSFTNEGLRERCITRDLKWGVPVPTEDKDMANKVFYVWFDAPIGYISITSNLVGKEHWKEWWQNPENVKLYQFMGKDNVPFHTVIFPATLIGTDCNYTLVHRLSTTEYLNYENTKFSKANGVGVFGDAAMKTNIASEIWRYYLIAMRPEQADADFNWNDFQAKNNNELLANLGNFVNRVLVFTHKNLNGVIPELKEEKLDVRDNQFMKNVLEKYNEYCESMNNTNMKEALKLFMEISSLGNAFLQVSEPWKLLKKDSDKYDLPKAEAIFYLLLAFTRFLGAIAEPFMPSFSAKLYEILNLKYTEEEAVCLKRINSYISGNKDAFRFLIRCNLIECGRKINEPKPLFRKITDEEIKQFRDRFKGKKEEKEDEKVGVSNRIASIEAKEKEKKKGKNDKKEGKKEVKKEKKSEKKVEKKEEIKGEFKIEYEEKRKYKRRKKKYYYDDL